MKRLSVVFVLCAIFLPIRAYSQIQMPTPKEGDRWEFKAATTGSSSSTSDRLSGNYEVVYLKGQLEAYELADGKKAPVGPLTSAQLRRMVPFGQDEMQYLKFPISVGNKWAINYTAESPGVRNPPKRSAEFNVEQEGETTTTAGTFKTLKIKGSGQTLGRPVTQAWEYFYSSNCKAITKYNYDSAVGGNGGKVEIELTKFTPGN